MINTIETSKNVASCITGNKLKAFLLIWPVQILRNLKLELISLELLKLPALPRSIYWVLEQDT